MAKNLTRLTPQNMRLTPYGKRGIAADMYGRGRAFIYAAILLSREKGDANVELHLICQGLEIILKALLLAMDFDRFQVKLKDFGHDLAKLGRNVNTEAKRRPFGKKLDAELQVLSGIYKAMLLRYAGVFGILVRPETIPKRRVMAMTVALIVAIETRKIFDMRG